MAIALSFSDFPVRDASRSQIVAECCRSVYADWLRGIRVPALSLVNALPHRVFLNREAIGVLLGLFVRRSLHADQCGLETDQCGQQKLRMRLLG